MIDPEVLASPVLPAVYGGGAETAAGEAACAGGGRLYFAAVPAE